MASYTASDVAYLQDDDSENMFLMVFIESVDDWDGLFSHTAEVFLDAFEQEDNGWGESFGSLYSIVVLFPGGSITALDVDPDDYFSKGIASVLSLDEGLENASSIQDSYNSFFIDMSVERFD